MDPLQANPKAPPKFGASNSRWDSSSLLSSSLCFYKAPQKTLSLTCKWDSPPLTLRPLSIGQHCLLSVLDGLAHWAERWRVD